jgi:hypothetical protein
MCHHAGDRVFGRLWHLPPEGFGDADNAEAIMALEARRESGLWKSYWQTPLPNTT